MTKIRKDTNKDLKNHTKRLIPIYTTRGDLGAFLVYPYVYNAQGEWIGWVAPNRIVYSVHGQYTGQMTGEPRILRKREFSYDQKRLNIPPPEILNIRPPAHVPLPPQMAEIPLNMIDVLDEFPETLQPVDFGDLREDMD